MIEEEPQRIFAVLHNKKTYPTVHQCHFGHAIRFTSTTDCAGCYFKAQFIGQQSQDAQAIRYAQEHHEKTYRTAFACPQGHRLSRFTEDHKCCSCFTDYIYQVLPARQALIDEAQARYR